MTRSVMIFDWQNDQGMLHEQARLIAQINPAHTLIFRSKHASKTLPLKGTLPNDCDRLLNEIQRAEKGNQFNTEIFSRLLIQRYNHEKFVTFS